MVFHRKKSGKITFKVGSIVGFSGTFVVCLTNTSPILSWIIGIPTAALILTDLILEIVEAR